MAKGAEHYRDIGMGRSRGTLPIQIAGNIRHGGLFEAGFGADAGRDCCRTIGGGTAHRAAGSRGASGGPLGAYFPPALFDTPFDYEAFAARDGLIGHGGVVVFDDTVDMAKQARFAMEFCAVESCGKCTPCRIGSVRGMEVIDRIWPGSDVKANIALLRDLCETMKFGSLCALGGFIPYPVMSALTHFPEDFRRDSSACVSATGEGGHARMISIPTGEFPAFNCQQENRINHGDVDLFTVMVGTVIVMAGEGRPSTSSSPPIHAIIAKTWMPACAGMTAICAFFQQPAEWSVPRQREPRRPTRIVEWLARVSPHAGHFASDFQELIMPLIHETDYGTPASPATSTVTLTIDGQSVTVPEGTSIMRAAMGPASRCRSCAPPTA